MATFSSSSRRTSEGKQNYSRGTSYKVSGNKANYLLSELDPATYYEMTLMSKNSAGVSQDKYLFGTYTIAGSEFSIFFALINFLCRVAHILPKENFVR